MTVKKSKGKLRRLCCDFPGCKAQWGNPFPASAIAQVAGSARMHGWHINKDKFGIWRHECPAHDDRKGGREARPAPMSGAPALRYRADIDA